MLDQIIPFRYLSPDQRAGLRSELQEHTFADGDTIVAKGDTADERVYLLVEGVVEIAESGGGLITAGHYFGERAALFEEPRQVDIRAKGPVRVWTIEGERFLGLLTESSGFAQALGDILRHKQGIFVPFDRFLAELLRGVESGSIDLQRLLPLYKSLDPALHRHASDDDVIDFAALSYAVRRLPDNVTRAFAYYLTETLPSHYGNPDEMFTPVPTAARRHAIYELLPGKNMVLIRDGRSDIIDLICCLCLFTIEARKIRKRMQPAFTGGKFPFNDEERAGLSSVWPSETKDRVREIVLHHEDTRVELHRQLNNYNSAHAERWCAQVAEATHELLGADPTSLPADWNVHIISSNTHSVPNCLSTWLATHGEDILVWAKKTQHELVDDPWPFHLDAVYAIARDYFRAHPEQAAAKKQADRESGILRLVQTAFTGIQVQLIDARELDGDALDDGITRSSSSARTVIVNIDYAFGEQASHIIVNLLTLFGRNVRSVNVLGKAGGLVGKRGDILVATGFIEQMSGMLQPLHTRHVDTESLRKRVDGRIGVHSGNVLTVPGTLLQNKKMLQFNRHISRCIGLEMEGTHYVRKILESVNRDVISEDVALRFLYYVSDLPLNHEANLSGRMRAVEGIPPLYAVTREVLSSLAF